MMEKKNEKNIFFLKQSTKMGNALDEYTNSESGGQYAGTGK